MSVISIVIGEKYYNKDPRSSELGKKIIATSVELMDEIGFEQFTFKKLAERINSAETSIYRYFDNKLILLLYLTTWYWSWLDYMIDFKTFHIEDKEEKLKQALKIVCHSDNPVNSLELPGVNITALRNLVVNEADKAYLNHNVDEINDLGLFRAYKGLCHKISHLIHDINPKYPYSHALISTVLEATRQQSYFAQHLPSLTEITKDSKEGLEGQVYAFVEDLVIKAIKN